GFDVHEVRHAFDDQVLVIEAQPAPNRPADEPPVPADRPDVFAATRRFAAASKALTARWRSRVAQVAATGGRTVLWAASSKAVAFLAALGPEADRVVGAVDINPHKHGSFLAGTGHPVLAPDDLVGIDPSLVVVMNPIYLD